MRISTRMLVFAVAALFSPAALAQTTTVTSLRQPVTYQQTAYDYESYYAQEGGEQAAPAAPEAAAAAPAPQGCAPACGTCGTHGCSTCNPCANGCSNGCGNGCCNACEEEAEGPCRLFDDCCFFKTTGLSLTGWVNGSFTWNPDNPADRFNGPVTFNDRSNEFQLNQFYIVGQKAIDTSEGFDIGGRIDLLYGTDWRFTPALGLELNTDGTRNWNQDNRFYGLAMPQLYAEVGYGDLSVKLGHWYTFIGYQMVTAPDNFFISQPLTFQFGEPFTHTGALATYKLNDNWTVLGGIHRGWDQWEDINDQIGGIGGLTWTSDDANSSLAYAMSISDEDPNNRQSRYVHSIVAQQGLTDKLKYVFQSDLGWQNDASVVTPGQDAEWYGVNQYLFYTLNDKWGLGGRAEWWRDDDGAREISNVGDPSGSAYGGFAGNFYECAAGLNYLATANFRLRSEARWDWYTGPANAANQLPYDDGTDSNQFVWGNDFIFLW
ncbi:MAG: outer membrane beta-barrel protein [Pirellulales bacterium]|nr:outer membrane beta-barrel protein [Pirellulales bacterium]